MNKYFILTIAFFILSCQEKKSSEKIVNNNSSINQKIDKTSIVILGTIQDAGFPQIACKKSCCASLFEHPDHTRQVISLGLLDKQNNKTYLFEATPDIAMQMKLLTKLNSDDDNETVNGIFLTHAHIGHYTGLMYLGKEAMDAQNMPVFVMPKMKDFLSNNGPWNQLLLRKNVELHEMENGIPVQVSKSINVTPFIVPHRDEYSETVGFRIEGPNKSALFIPDIDKWEKWGKNIIQEIKTVDYAFLDATFFSGKELDNRDISQIPHPLIIESLSKFKNLNKNEKNKIIFIHFNHTNPVLNPESQERKLILDQGFRIGEYQDVFEL